VKKICQIIFIFLAGTQAAHSQAVGSTAKIVEHLSKSNIEFFKNEPHLSLSWSDDSKLDPWMYPAIDIATVFHRLEGCTAKFIAEEYGEFRFVCPNRPAVNKCYNESYSGVAQRQSNGRLNIRFVRDTDWAVERCGKSPIFSPPLPKVSGN
jgi:hypothetical protein